MEKSRIRSDADWERLYSASGLPTIRLMTTLPLWACVAFAARCSRRVQPFIQRYWPDIPEGHLTCIEECLKLAETDTQLDENLLDPLLHGIGNAFSDADAQRAKIDRRTVNKCTWAIGTVHITAYAMRSALRGKKWSAADNASDAAKHACYAVEANDQIVSDIRSDFESLRAEAEKADWSEDSLAPLFFFASRQSFTFVDYNSLSDRILDLARAIDRELIDYFTKHPDKLYSIEPRVFEELIAELFECFGFDVELTSQTRDGGRDIIAICERVVKQKYLIECKRYAPHKKIDIGIVQRLHGVVTDEMATKGIIATTGFFTLPAKSFVEKNVWRLESRDFYGIQEWLHQYQKLKDHDSCRLILG